MKFSLIKPHLIAVGVFVVICFMYFSPLLEGKRLRQSDIVQHVGMSKEIADYRARTGHEPLWTNSMFGGMPSFQISTLYPSNLVRYVDQVIQLGLPRPANYLFLCLIGFYFLLITLNIDFMLAIGGAILFAFSSFFFIILDAGHNSQAAAIAYMAPVVAGFILTYRGEFLKGGIITGLALALEIYCNHLQVTYYLFLTLLAFIGFQLYVSVKEKELSKFIKASAVILVAGLLALGTNITNLWTTYEYSQFSTRGPSELSHKKGSSGLDKNYALDWSYGVGESMTLLIPNFMGGASTGELGTGSETYKVLQESGMSAQQARQYVKNLPLYHGTQPFTSGPVYYGAIACMLFILGLFLVKGPVKWWLLSVSILSLFLAWGKNFGLFTDIVFDFLPGYNKFRAVSMGLVIGQLTVPLLGLIALKNFFTDDKNTFDIKKKALLKSLYITGGILVFFILFASALDFSSISDEELKKNQWPDVLINALRSDRESLLRMDALRSLFFAGSCFALLFFYLKGKIKKEAVFISIALLVLIDMWTVDKRYLNNENFVSAKQVAQPFQPTEADQMIRQDNDPDFRVFNLSVNTFNDASTSYFHKSIGGYHAAKPKRYQELIEAQISKNNMSVLNMLNTKYFIMPANNQGGEPVAQRNPEALGHSWFVREIKYVPNADEELNALSNFDPGKTAIADKRFENILGQVSSYDSTSRIILRSYEPNHLVYESKSNTEQLAVFSEMYYDKGWKAIVDGKEMPYGRVNYILRAMRIPAGNHKIEFKFEPASYYTGEKISLVSSGLLIIMALGLFIRNIIRKKD